MSTKIYDGFRFVSSDLGEIHTLLMAYRPAVKAATETAIAGFLAETAADHIDQRALNGQPAGKPLGDAYDELRERQKEVRVTGRRDPEIDFDFKLSVMPYGDRVFGIAFCDQPAWKAAFTSLPWVEPWPYWNNSDGPDGVSRDAWRARGDTWNAVLSGDEWDRPVGCGYGYDFMPPPHMADAETVLAHLPTHEDRVRKWAGDCVRTAEFRRLLAEAGIEAGDRAAMRFVFDAERNMRGEGGDACREVEAERIRPLLPAITLSILRGWSPEEPTPSHPGATP